MNGQQYIKEKWLKHRVARENLHQKNNEASIMLSYIKKCKKLNPQSTILDIGSGMGTTTHFMAKKEHKSCGIEIDIDIIRLATNRKIHKMFFSEHSIFINSDAENLPFKNNVYDACILNAVLEHVNKWEYVLHETIRVLKNGGVFLLTTTNRVHPLQSEINNFPFYPWLPKKIKIKIMKHIMEKRRDLVNWTNRPAIHWFTYPQLKKFLLKEGCTPYELFQLVNPERFKHWKKNLLETIQKHSFLMIFFHICIRAVTILSIVRKDN